MSDSLATIKSPTMLFCLCCPIHISLFIGIASVFHWFNVFGGSKSSSVNPIYFLCYINYLVSNNIIKLIHFLIPNFRILKPLPCLNSAILGYCNTGCYQHFNVHVLGRHSPDWFALLLCAKILRGNVPSTEASGIGNPFPNLLALR